MTTIFKSSLENTALPHPIQESVDIVYAPSVVSGMQRYDRLSRHLHWLSASVILWATVTGFYMSTDNVSADIAHAIAEFNVGLTTVFIPVFLIRVVHSLRRKTPPLKGFTRIEKWLAKTMHRALYVAVTVVLISGVLMMSKPISLFGFFALPTLISDSSLIAFFDQIHHVFTRLLGSLIIIHLLAVIKHHLNRVNLLQRML
jgi:cytochrome b561